MAAFYIQVSIGTILIISGWFFRKYPPRDMNMFYGYRTGRAFHSKEAWEYAQKYSAKVLARSGWLLFLTSPIYLLINLDHYVTILASVSISLIFVFMPILFTERALRKHFPTDSKIN